VGVRHADHAELVGVDADLRFQFESALEPGTAIFTRQQLRGLGVEVEVALVPVVVIGELVVGREQRMRFAVILDLGDQGFEGGFSI
jgi:hypothetical protein